MGQRGESCMTELAWAAEAAGACATAALAAWCWKLRLRLAVLETRQETIHSWLKDTDIKLDEARATLQQIVGMLKAGRRRRRL